MRAMPFLRLLLVALAWPALSSGQTYSLNMYQLSAASLSGNEYGYTLTQDSTQLFSGEPSMSGTTISVHSNNVQWYSAAVSVANPSGLPSSFQSLSTSTYSSFYQVRPHSRSTSADTSRADRASDLPHVRDQQQTRCGLLWRPGW